MATEVVKTVKPSGGDYSSLSAWEAGEQRDLVAADEIAVAECYSMVDTNKVLFSGWTTDADHYIKATTPVSERHNGIFDTSKYLIDVTATGDFTIVLYCYQTNHVKFEGIQVQFSNDSYSTCQVIYFGSVAAGAEMDVSYCIFKNILSGTYTDGIYQNDSDATIRVWNNIFYDFNDGGRAIRATNMTAGYFYNNTIYNCYTGIEATGNGGKVVKNCLAQNCTYKGFNGTFQVADCSNNCTDDFYDSSPGANPSNGNVVFVDEGADDFHLDESDAVAKDAGVDLSADASLAFSDDIDGDIRSGTWDIGADEVVTGFDIPLQDLLKSGSIYLRSNMIFTINGVGYKWDFNGLVNVSTGVKTHILRDNVMVFIG